MTTTHTGQTPTGDDEAFVDVEELGLTHATVRDAVNARGAHWESRWTPTASFAIEYIDADRHCTHTPARLNASLADLPALQTLLTDEPAVVVFDDPPPPRIKGKSGAQTRIGLSSDRHRWESVARELLAHDRAWHRWADPHGQDRGWPERHPGDHDEDAQQRHHRRGEALVDTMIGRCAGEWLDDNPIRATVVEAIARDIERAATHRQQ